MFTFLFELAWCCVTQWWLLQAEIRSFSRGQQYPVRGEPTKNLQNVPSRRVGALNTGIIKIQDKEENYLLRDIIQ